MNCPVCGDPNVYERKGGGHKYACPSCGWGQGSGGMGLGDLPWLHTRPARAVGLVLLWCVSAVIVFGPWLTAEFWFPAKTLHVSMEDFYRYYWVGLGGYLLVSWFIDPDVLNYNRPRRWFLESRSEYLETQKLLRTILMLALPGQIIWYTLGATWRFFRSP